ncbi:hypothetical protein [Aliamphritea spongicola]|uniref:hypothetical protein n=1 Tax=Aliamphritea spongicola TaxID=707589 RepID=UPI00196B625C|nr:hypothetical protein [Aliamphritea spongicola]MBN3563198.1 hypothetical protein [Aliamphritea spongicola]
MQAQKFKIYQMTAIFSMLFALLGFSYNVWRMEVTEENSNIRTACFEILLELSNLEQQIYALHYDKDQVAGNPRKGWVKVGLIADLSTLTKDSVIEEAQELKAVWSNKWDKIEYDQSATNNMVTQIEAVRSEIKLVLSTLE